MPSSANETLVTRQDLQRRTAELLPILTARAAQTEQLRQIPPETVQDLIDSGLIRIGNPKHYGGLGIEYDAVFDVDWELGRACGATAWCYGLWAVHNWWIGHFPEAAQEEFFANGPDVLAASALNPTEGQAEPVFGGLHVSGHWRFSSGCDAASWVMVAVPSADGHQWALIPRTDYEIVDSWFASGMCGTGSKDIVIEDKFVPTHRTMDPSRAGNGDWTGWELHQRLSYRLPLRCMTGWDLVAPIIGMAQGAVDTFTTSLQGTSGHGRTADSMLVQACLAEAAVEVDAARELHRRAIGEILEKAAGGETFSNFERARYRRDKTFAARLCVRAINRLFDASGGGAIYASATMQRFHRDIHAASHHQGINWNAAAEDYGRQALGLPPAPGRYV
ncbi:MAG: acyl-CoA dehydrogenase family protein [bacterium]|nr:acyl-CoA dehydrogenase family protein [bacterium]